LNPTSVVVGIIVSITLFGTCFSAPYPASAANNPPQSGTWEDERRSLSVTGMSNAKVAPDRVAVSFSAESQEKTAHSFFF
jgi:uncharacterized protein YggE